LRKGREETVMPAENLQNGLPLDLAGIGDRKTLDQLFSLTYEELRRLAASVKRSDPSCTLNPTALVNEAWLKLAKSPGIHAMSCMHFKRIAARAMRQLLIEAARRRNARKRGGDGDVAFVTFDDSVDAAATCAQDLLALDTVLDNLAQLSPRQAMIVESRFFGGLEMREIASLLGLSEATVLRDWRAAKAWLGHELRKGD
jgi:RNA polymerase sigma factor (TIGR02999 family)